MALSKEYLDFILEQLSELEEISYRAMMGEYIIYYRGKIIGGIYDDKYPYAGGAEHYAVYFEDPDRIKVEICLE